jgi:hypothetical protein
VIKNKVVLIIKETFVWMYLSNINLKTNHRALYSERYTINKDHRKHLIPKDDGLYQSNSKNIHKNCALKKTSPHSAPLRKASPKERGVTIVKIQRLAIPIQPQYSGQTKAKKYVTLEISTEYMAISFYNYRV